MKAVVVSLVCLSATMFNKVDTNVTARAIHIESFVDPAQRDLVMAFFKRYNPAIKPITAQRFMTVANAYGFTEDSVLFTDCIHQICFESQAKQSSRSPSGAIGICQITPTTAFDFLHKSSKEERKGMIELGATSLQWAIDGEYSYADSTNKPYLGKKLRSKAKHWLSDENNNLILWGCMMHKNLSRFDKERAFLRYHLGCGGLDNFTGDPHKHEYIVLMSKITLKKKRKGAV